MTSKLTRERIELIANFHRAMTLPPSHDEIEELARLALAAMDSEPVAQIEVLSGVLVNERWMHQSLPNGWHDLFACRHAQQPVVNEDLYKLANHIASSKSGLPDEWQDWAEELETDIRRAAMLQAGNSPVIPDGYVMVPKKPTKEILDEFDSIIDYGAEDSVDAWSRLLAAAPQEVK